MAFRRNFTVLEIYEHVILRSAKAQQNVAKYLRYKQ